MVWSAILTMDLKTMTLLAMICVAHNRRSIDSANWNNLLTIPTPTRMSIFKKASGKLRQTSLIDYPEANSESVLRDQNSNQIFDPGCLLQRITGPELAKNICLALWTNLKILLLCWEPLWIGYGHNCTNATLMIGKWFFALTNLCENKAKLQFLVTECDEQTLVGNDVLQK